MGRLARNIESGMKTSSSWGEIDSSWQDYEVDSASHGPNTIKKTSV